MCGHEVVGQSYRTNRYLAIRKAGMRNGDRSGRLCSEKKKKVSRRSAPREENFEGRCKGCACRNPYRGVATEVGRGTERWRQNTGDSELSIGFEDLNQCNSLHK